MQTKWILCVLLFGFLTALLLGTTGCTAIGFTGGLAYDKRTADADNTVSFDELKEDEYIKIYRKNGETQNGRVIKSKNNHKLEFVFISGNYRISQDLKTSIESGEIIKIARLKEKHSGRLIGGSLGFLADFILLLYLLSFNSTGGEG